SVVDAAAGGVAVRADARDTAITLAPTSGRGADYAVNGTVAVTRANHETIAIVDRSAGVDAGGLDVDADQSLVIWSVAGAVSLGQNLGLGLGTAINDLATRTVAAIGDSVPVRPDALGASPPGAPAVGHVAVDVLNVDASTSGLVGTAAVAGAKAGGTSTPPGSGQPGSGEPGSGEPGSDAARTGFDDRTSAVQSDADGFAADDALEGP